MNDNGIAPNYHEQLHRFASDPRTTESGLRGALHDAATALEAQAEFNHAMMMLAGQQRLRTGIAYGLVITLAVVLVAVLWS